VVADVVAVKHLTVRTIRRRRRGWYPLGPSVHGAACEMSVRSQVSRAKKQRRNGEFAVLPCCTRCTADAWTHRPHGVRCGCVSTVTQNRGGANAYMTVTRRGRRDSSLEAGW